MSSLGPFVRSLNFDIPPTSRHDVYLSIVFETKPKSVNDGPSCNS